MTGGLTRFCLLVQDLLDRPATQDGFGLRRGRLPARVGTLVALLDQQPLLPVGGRARAAERIRALDLLPEHEDLHVALRDRLRELHRLAASRLRDVLEDAAVPDDHRPRAILALSDHALPLEVLERVVLRSHGEPLVARIEGGPLRHRPGGEHAVDLESQVVVLRGRGVLLEREPRVLAARLALSLAAGGLLGLREVPLAGVFLQGARHQIAPSSSAIESANAPRSPSRSEIASGSEQRPNASSPPWETT